MRLTKRLLDYLHSVFDKAPAAALALRLSYDGVMTWKVEDAVLTTEVVGGSGVPLRVDLRQFNMQQLATHLVQQTGYSIEYLNSDLLAVGARALLDGTNRTDQNNGDHLHAHTSVLWSYLEALAVELDEAQRAIVEMLKQMSTRSASDIWLDELGLYYGVPRQGAEPDSSYGPRIIAEVLRPRGNNVAIAMAIKAYTGHESTVRDVTVFGPMIPRYDGEHTHNALILHNSTAKPRYGLFDVTYGYDLIGGGDYRTFEALVRGIVERVRDAGTHMRSLILQASEVVDSAELPTDGEFVTHLGQQLEEAFPETDDSALVMSRTGMSMRERDVLADLQHASDVDYNFDYRHTGLRRYDGKITYSGGYIFQGATLESQFAGSMGLAGEHLHEIVNVTLPSNFS